MDWEFDILYAIQSIRTPFLDKLMAFLSTLGNAGALWMSFHVPARNEELPAHRAGTHKDIQN